MAAYLPVYGKGKVRPVQGDVVIVQYIAAQQYEILMPTYHLEFLECTLVNRKERFENLPDGLPLGYALNCPRTQKLQTEVSGQF